MPKFNQSNKQGGRTAVTKPSAPRSVADLLARGPAVLSQISDQSSKQAFWQSWLSEHLPDPLATHVTGTVERDGALTFFAESAAWAARLRYALRELEPQIKATDESITTVIARVMPRR